MTIGEIIRTARLRHGLSQRQLGDRCGLDNATISKIESGTTKYPPRVDTLEAIAFELNLNADELIKLSGRVDEEMGQMLQELLLQQPIKTRLAIEALYEKPELLDLLVEST